MNQHFAKKLATSFGSEKGADCELRFVKEAPPGSSASATGTDKEPPSGSPASATGTDEDKKEELLAEPFPAHSFVLCRISERLDCQAEGWRPEKVPRKEAATSATSPGPHRKRLRIPLGGPEEVPAALAAIKFGYTGQVDAASVGELLMVRRQGEYLQVEGCAAECDAAVKGMLQGAGSSGSSAGGGSSGGDGATPVPPALQFFSCQALWPEEGDTAFAELVPLAKTKLVSHFGDTLSVLNSPSLRSQLLELPAEGLLALLESDDFGTDEEATVLLLLATWMRRHAPEVDEQTRKRLCRQVRLVQLSRPYLYDILPALAYDYDHSDAPEVGWLPIRTDEALFIARYASAGPQERQQLDKCRPCRSDANAATYNTTPRRQCLPAEGRTFSWHLTAEKLQRVLAGLQPGKEVQVLSSAGPVYAAGFEWTPVLCLTGGKSTAWLGLFCDMPPAYKVGGSQLDSPDDGSQLDDPDDDGSGMVLVPIHGSITVHRSAGDRQRRDITGAFKGIEDAPSLYYYSWIKAVPLRTQPPANGVPPGEGGAPGSSALLAPWADYLRDGKVTGSLTWLQESRSA